MYTQVNFSLRFEEHNVFTALTGVSANVPDLFSRSLRAPKSSLRVLGGRTLAGCRLHFGAFGLPFGGCVNADDDDRGYYQHHEQGCVRYQVCAERFGQKAW